MGKKEDDEKAYTTYDNIIGKSIRRSTRKAVKALTHGLFKGSDPVEELRTSFRSNPIMVFGRLDKWKALPVGTIR